MDEIYRQLGREREKDLLREVERVHGGARPRPTRHERRTRPSPLRMTLETTCESLRATLHRIGITLRAAR